MVILEHDKLIEALRQERERICFPIINRGKLWYDTLTNEQYAELKQWYYDWLDVTKTQTIPEAPNWLYDKIKDEEITL